LPTAGKWLAGALIVLALAAGLTYSYRHHAELARGRAEWDAEVARVRESGDPLTAAELEVFYKVPDGEDLTAQYLKAIGGCRSDYKAAGDLPLVGSSLDDIPIPPQSWPQLEQAETFLEQYREPLDELVQLGKLRGVTRIDTDDIQQLQDFRSAIRLLVLQKAVQAHRHDYGGAANSLIAMHRIADALRYDATGNAQIFRVAFARIAISEVVPVARDPSFPANELRRLQETLMESDWQHAFFLSCLSERSRNFELLHQPVSVAFPGDVKRFSFGANFVVLKSRPGDAARVLSIQSDYVDVSRGDLPSVMASFQAANLRVAAWSHEAIAPHPDDVRPAPTAENIAISYIGVYQPQQFLEAAARERAAIAILAIERFRRERGELPDTLDDLVPDYIAAVPEDPCNGYPLRMVKRNGGYAVYGVGSDLVDNVGGVETKDQHRATDDGLFVASSAQ
jgi:hypothetical protein